MLKQCGRFFLTVSLAIVMAAGVLLSSETVAASSPDKMESVTVNVGPAHYQQIPDEVSALGTLEAIRSTGLSFLASGHLSQKLFKDGATVKKGDVVAKLGDSTIEAQLASAKANLEETQSNYNRYELLKDSGVFSKQDYISVSTALKVAKAKYASVLEQEQQLSLMAPFSGTLGKYNYSVGSQIGVGTVIVDLVQLNPMKVSYSLNQSDKSKVKLGQVVVIHSDAWPDKQFKGVVTYISPTVNPNTGRFDVDATLNNSGYQLSPGGLVHVDHILGKGLQVLVVPQTAVNVDEDRSYVYIVRNGKAHQVSVEAGQATDNGNMVINDGLKVGEEVVVDGIQKLSEGTPVNVVKHLKPLSSGSSTSGKSSAAVSKQVKQIETVKPVSQAASSFAPSQSEESKTPQSGSLGNTPSDEAIKQKQKNRREQTTLPSTNAESSSSRISSGSG